MGLLTRFFTPPPMPPIHLPIPARMIPGVKVAIGEAFKSVYYAGVVDGFCVGMVLATAIILGLALRGNWFKGVGSVASSFLG